MIDVREETLLTVAAAARRLGKDPDTVRAWIDRGRLEGVHIAGRLHTSLEAIERASRPAGRGASAKVETTASAKTTRYLRSKGLLR